MKRTPLNKIGKIGRANIEARQRIAEIAEERGMLYCELQFPFLCTVNWPVAPAHRHKRAWYKGNVELLSDINQWVVACQNCHNKIENDSALTEVVFNNLRPKQENTI